VTLLPLTAGNIVLAYNLEGVTGLKQPRCLRRDLPRQNQEVE
jgi:hypothetical protein